MVQLTASVASPGSSLITMGIMVVDALALAAGVGSLQAPGTDIGSDWLWWGTVPINLNGGSVASPNTDGQTVMSRVTIDSKAMRKIGLNQAVVFITENQPLVSTQTVQVIFDVRCLLKR